MATTDQKPGFRLPWSADRSESAPPVGEEASQADPTIPQEHETPAMIDAAPAATDHEAAVAPEATHEATPADPAPETAAPTPAAVATPVVPDAPARKPNKFMADLTRAMQAAAETAREDTLARFGADAKVHIEEIHTASGSEATELRKRADDDVAAIREWSKAEIARIREETDERISHRKERLEREIEGHAAEIEARIERVQARVAAFEAEMASFFERLLAEGDPTRFAAMAESLPEPPSFDQLIADDGPTAVVASAAAPTPFTATEPVHATEDRVDAPPTEAAATPEPPVAEATFPAEPPLQDDPAGDGDGSGQPAPSQAAEDTGDLFGLTTEAPTSTAGADAPVDADDPRLAMLGVTPDFAAAEAEAATYASIEDGSDEPVAEIADDALAARLAGLVPESDGAASDAATSTLVVTGLVSVASIAGFKRHLSRVVGVHSVGVSSGPDGEFVFTVSHDPSCGLRDAVTTLPGFGARVTGETESGITVAAHDPEAEA